jgi:hypothetical protein
MQRSRTTPPRFFPMLRDWIPGLRWKDIQLALFCGISDKEEEFLSPILVN